jgi:hypothetical protein
MHIQGVVKIKQAAGAVAGALNRAASRKQIPVIHSVVQQHQQEQPL